MYRQDMGRVVDACDRRDVADEIEIELVVERRVDRVRRTHHEQRISVCRRAHDPLGGDIAAATRPVLDDKRLLNVSPRIGLCTYTSTTCLGVGWKRRVTTIQSAWLVCRPVSTRCLWSWSTLTSTHLLGVQSAGRGD